MKLKTILVAVTALLLTEVSAQTNSTNFETSAFTGKPQYLIMTKRAGVFLGNIKVELFPAIAPKHVKNFDSLVSTQFYDSTAFHRVIPGFMIQGGDPNSRSGPKSTWGLGDVNQPTVNAEFSVLQHLRGILSAARDNNINSATSQFFICVAPAAWLNGQYSIYGKVISGMNYVDTIVLEPRDVNDNPYKKIEMFVTYTGSNDTVPNIPVLDTPVSGTLGVTTNKQLKWFAVNGAIMYRVEVATDSLFTNIFWTKNVTTTLATVTGLTATTTYYWRVHANNGGNISAYSTVWKFSTNFTDVNSLSFAEQGYSLEQNMPNPVTSQTMIRYTLPAKGKVTLKLLDITGRELMLLVDEEKNKGEYQLNLDLEKFSAGIYFYQLQAGSYSSTRKLVLGK